MKQLILSVLIAAVLLGLGVFHGLATDRWADPNAVVHPGGAFVDLPASFGSWNGEALPRQADEDPKTSVINRKYIDAISGRWVVTSITSGRAGRVSIHNPEHCYLGSGYKVVDSIHQETITSGGQPAKFWTGHFEKKKPSGVESIRIYWGWSFDGRWQAPEYPRLYFAGKPRLHKLYLIHPVAVGGEPDDTTPYKDFFAQYVAELSRCLAP